ncbi:MAG TPA: sigma-54 dependent transcriptional regulator [Thermoanaerobaculia bacterium]|nr:sigma-54 dependent transcriptional regulator [Thermoanaerobaculia bacterium]
MRPKILLVDDEPSLRAPIRRYLEANGYEVREAPTVNSGEASFRDDRPDLAVLDFELPDGTALDLIPRLKALDPDVPLIVLTGHGSIDVAVATVKLGAEHFLTKPPELAALTTLIERTLDNQRTRRRDQAARRSQEERGAPNPFLGTAPAVAALAAEAQLAVAGDSPVLIMGETGSGKGVLARWLHDNGARADEAFVDINCAGLSRELLESELFGHARGAFTGAIAEKKGLLEVAHRGTLFLDEIGDMDVALQPKFLKALEEKRFRRLGETSERQVDVRLVAATNHDLGELVREKRFRADLYYRINTLVMRVAPLRERTADIPLLAAALLRRLTYEMGRPELELGEDAVEALVAYPWPGNVRELRNVLERGVLAAEGGGKGNRQLQRRHLRFDAGPVATASLGDGAHLTLAELERRHIERVLELEKGHVVTAAERLGIPRSTLYQKLKEYGIDPASYR